MMKRQVITISKGITRHPLYRMREPVDFCLEEGEQMAIVGPNASGKSRLVNILIGRYPLLMNEVHYDWGDAVGRGYENLRYMAFRDSYGDYDPSYYYQQRWHALEVDQLPSVADQFPGITDEQRHSKLFRMLSIDALWTKRLVMLSSGEMRRLQLAKALLSEPSVLILDNPFIGLDAATREQLRVLLQQLICDRKLQLILVLSRAEEIPDFITHVVPVQQLTCLPKVSLTAYMQQVAAQEPCEVIDADGLQLPSTLLPATDVPIDDASVDDAPVIDFRDVTLRYGEHTIFDHLYWTVHRGEHWALEGHNGSGKSALLGLVCADNPQSYACDIRLFGRRRGTGESIWDIKKRIGYVSPEMHRAYLKDLPAIDIVASGLHDSIGLYRRPRPEQQGQCLQWMRVFGIEALAQRTFLTLSSGEQRLVLLARAFVKNPELLILDEPLHGLDSYWRARVRQIIEAFCADSGKTLIMVTHYREELPACITHYKQLG